MVKSAVSTISSGAILRILRNKKASLKKLNRYAKYCGKKEI